MIQRALGFLMIMATAACQQSTGGLTPLYEGPAAPAGTPEVTQAVDGLIVGHRLMAAGEYELALKAYYRAAGEQGITVDVLSALGSANLKLARLGQAEALLREAIEQDETFVPAWNNLGVTLMEQGNVPEATLTFQKAYALDDGESTLIRDNLRLALAKSENSANTSVQEEQNYKLVRRGSGDFVLTSSAS